MTPWGKFSLSAQLSPEIQKHAEDGTVVVIKQEVGGRAKQDVFTLSEHGASACLDGTFILGAGAGGTIELFALGGSTIRIVEAARAPAARRDASGGTRDRIAAGVDSWVAQLASLPDTASAEVVERERQDVADQIGRPVAVVRSSRFGSLRSGWWMFCYSGHFRDGRAALSFCAQHGRTADTECVGRWLSHALNDRRYVCHFSGASTQPSICVRRQ